MRPTVTALSGSLACALMLGLAADALAQAIAVVPADPWVRDSYADYDAPPRVRTYAAPYVYAPPVRDVYARQVSPVPPAGYDPAAGTAYLMIPLRPASCGKYRYWNGTRCLDARWDPPYTGPRW